MEVTGDDLAGIVDLFGGLRREELGHALSELAFKQGLDRDRDSFGSRIDAAVDAYQLVRFEEGEEDPLLLAGPAAFPSLPTDARDLVHILDVETRSIDRKTAGMAAVEQFEQDVETVLERGDTDSATDLIDISYELEAWTEADLGEQRERLDQL